MAASDALAISRRIASITPRVPSAARAAGTAELVGHLAGRAGLVRQLGPLAQGVGGEQHEHRRQEGQAADHRQLEGLVGKGAEAGLEAEHEGAQRPPQARAAAIATG